MTKEQMATRISIMMKANGEAAGLQSGPLAFALGQLRKAELLEMMRAYGLPIAGERETRRQEQTL